MKASSMTGADPVVTAFEPAPRLAPAVSPPAAWPRQLLRLAGTAALLAATAWFVDPRAVLDRLRALDARWLAAALALAGPMYLMLAARWWLTSRRIGAPLSFSRALADYLLSSVLNQTLPVGVAGDAVRAVRHGRRLRAAGVDGGVGRAIRSIVLERVSGLAVLAASLATAAATLVGAHPRLAAVALGEAVIIAAVVALVWRAGGRAPVAGRGGAVARLGDDARRGLFAAAPAQLALSTGILASLVAMFYCAGRATGLALDAGAVAQVTPLILAASLLPLAFAGWGVREAITAAIYGALGLDPVSGAAAAVTFGLLSLVASAPGLIVWLVPVDDRAG
jgi:uncharacterized membrane protein YbhN (UPF0104 family)